MEIFKRGENVQLDKISGVEMWGRVLKFLKLDGNVEVARNVINYIGQEVG